MASPEAILRRFKLEPRLDGETLLRAMYLCFLVDWKSCLETSRTISNIEWRKAAWGPFSPVVLAALVHSADLSDPRVLQGLDDELDEGSKRLIDSFREKYAARDIESFGKLVMSTYPLMFGETSAPLDLPRLAEVYKNDFRSSREAVPA